MRYSVYFSRFILDGRKPYQVRVLRNVSKSAHNGVNERQSTRILQTCRLGYAFLLFDDISLLR